MAFYKCSAVGFKAWITVQSNPNISVTAAIGDKSFSGITNSNGIVTIEVTRRGVYSITTTSGASATVNVNLPRRTYNIDAVYVGTPTMNVAGWSTNTACVYWSYVGSYHTGVNVVRDNTTIHTGTGSTLALTSTQNVTGFLASGLTTNTTYTFKVRQYYTINGRTFYGAYASKTFKAVSYASSANITSTGNWTVPTGVRSISVFLVGGGGGGGSSHNYRNEGTTYWTSTAHSGGGGGGGKTKTVTVSVTPGQVYACTIGAAGSAGQPTNPVTNGGAGGQTRFGSVSGATADGGNGGTSAWYTDYRYPPTSINTTGGSGGSGGGTGGTTGSTNGGSGGSNGGNGTASLSSGVGGSGQGTTTKAWGDSSQTAYAGGGGAGCAGIGSNGSYHDRPGDGGKAGGSSGGSGGLWTNISGYNSNPQGGTASANTGGGGGGSACNPCGMRRTDSGVDLTKYNGGKGGSGIIRIRWS